MVGVIHSISQLSGPKLSFDCLLSCSLNVHLNEVVDLLRSCSEGGSLKFYLDDEGNFVTEEVIVISFVDNNALGICTLTVDYGDLNKVTDSVVEAHSPMRVFIDNYSRSRAKKSVRSRLNYNLVRIGHS